MKIIKFSNISLNFKNIYFGEKGSNKLGEKMIKKEQLYLFKKVKISFVFFFFY